MGRGRAKAKQTKVARELKYSSPTTDFDSLQRELSGGSSSSHRNGVFADQRSDGTASALGRRRLRRLAPLTSTTDRNEGEPTGSPSFPRLSARSIGGTHSVAPLPTRRSVAAR